MKKLRVFWILRTWQSCIVDKYGHSSHKYKKKQMVSDFDPDMDPNSASESIYKEYGRAPSDLSKGGPITTRFAEIVSHKIVELWDPVKLDIKAEKHVEQQLFPGTVMMDCLGKKQ